MTIPPLLAARARRAAVLVLAGLLGCGLSRSGSGEPSATVPLVFSNESRAQAEVWVVAPDVNTRRVGTVMAGETATLRVPREFYTKGIISIYTRMRGAATSSPGVYDLRVREDEQLHLRLPRTGTRLEVMR